MYIYKDFFFTNDGFSPSKAFDFQKSWYVMRIIVYCDKIRTAVLCKAKHRSDLTSLLQCSWMIHLEKVLMSGFKILEIWTDYRIQDMRTSFGPERGKHTATQWLIGCWSESTFQHPYRPAWTHHMPIHHSIGHQRPVHNITQHCTGSTLSCAPVSYCQHLSEGTSLFGRGERKVPPFPCFWVLWQAQK
jgi:hypothetical protein